VIRRAFLSLLACGTLLASGIGRRFLWDENQEPDISHYVLLYGQKSGEYRFYRISDTPFVDVHDLSAGYWYATVMAVNDKGIESPYAPEVEFKVTKKRTSKSRPDKKTSNQLQVLSEGGSKKIKKKK
jgi:hypothetical protein